MSASTKSLFTSVAVHSSSSSTVSLSCLYLLDLSCDCDSDRLKMMTLFNVCSLSQLDP